MDNTLINKINIHSNKASYNPTAYVLNTYLNRYIQYVVQIERRAHLCMLKPIFMPPTMETSFSSMRAKRAVGVRSGCTVHT